MPINPNIALGFKPTYELESPQNILANVMKQKGDQQTLQLNALKMQEAQRGIESQNALNRVMSEAYNPVTGKYDQSNVYKQLAAAGQGHLIPGQMKSEAERIEAENKSQKAKTDLLSAKMKQFRDYFNQNVRTPDQMRQFNASSIKDPVIGKFLQEQGATLEQMNKEVDDVEAAGPDAFNQYRLQQVLDADKFINANKPSIHFPPGSGKAYIFHAGKSTVTQVPNLDTGAGGNQGVTYRVDENTGELMALPSKLAPGASPVPRPVIGAGGAPVKGSVKQAGASNITEEEQSVISKAIAEGRLDPNKVNGRNARIIATTLIQNPQANLVNLGIDAASTGQAAKSLAVQGAKMGTAATEAAGMIEVTKGLSDKIDRTQYPNINAIANAVDKGTGGVDIVQLNASINALVNSYARAISPTGNPTVSDKNHAREVINSAYSSGQMNGILEIMKQEMDIAKNAAVKSGSHLLEEREKRFGRGKEKPPEGAGGNRPGLDEIFGPGKK
jgi:hypothetical protein